MYRILLADDEGIMLTSLTSMIQQTFGSECEVATAKTGRAALELSEEFRPDIVFMDIRMPGLNGIEAMQEIRKKDEAVLFIVITAYDKFDYAKDALSLGAFDFLTKPVKKTVIIDVLSKAMRQVEQEKKNKIDNLRIREKLETVIPVLETGFINNILIQEGENPELGYYLELMDIKEEYGYVILLQFGENLEEGVLTNPVGMSMRALKFYDEMKGIIIDFIGGIVGPVMTNRVVIAVPHEGGTLDYEERIQLIERTRNMIRNLEQQIDARFRAGIGGLKRMEELKNSYQEAFQSLNKSESRVAHIEDLPIRCEYDGDYPDNIEKRLFAAVEKADVEAAKEEAGEFFDWMITNYADCLDDIRLKVLEFTMRAEKCAFLKGGTYSFRYRKDYLPEMMAMNDYEQIRKWFLTKIKTVCYNIESRKVKQSETVVSQAKKYICVNFSEDISLDDVSRQVNISPYYFSKLFKEEEGVNFIDYLTQTRINYAKEILKDPNLSIKEVCVKSGYSDQNYFSRIFKKLELVTPSEYREGLKK